MTAFPGPIRSEPFATTTGTQPAMASSRKTTLARLLVLALTAGCAQGFKISQFPSSESLFSEGVRQMKARKWTNAIAAFDKLALDLPARDTLLPLAQFYLARAHAGLGEHLLAAQAYNRVAESFATDSLADDALYQAGREFQRLWRRPVLDSQYGGEAGATYQTLLGLYPDSEWRDSATAQLIVLQQWFAAKDYENAMHYVRRKAYDSAIIYLRDVVNKYPDAPVAKNAFIRLAQVYTVIRYKDDKADVCKTLNDKYPRDREVVQVCGTPPPTTTGTGPAAPAR